MRHFIFLTLIGSLLLTQSTLSYGAERAIAAESYFAYGLEIGDEDDPVQDDEEPAAMGPFVTSHEGVYHNPVYVDLEREIIELEDGSRWQVNPKHLEDTIDWWDDHRVLVRKDFGWFSNYDFRIWNIDTDEIVSVDMISEPIYNSPYTYYIKEIDNCENRVWLNDGSVWEFPSEDRGNVRKWSINDTIFIGFNCGWGGKVSTFPNILINMTDLSVARTVCTW